MSIASPTPYALIETDRGLSDEAEMLRQIGGVVQQACERSAVLGGALWELGNVAREASMDNWDGYGAQPISKGAVAAAKEFLSTFAAGYWPAPEISASPRGEVLIEWGTGPHNVFTLAFGENGEKYFAGLFGVNRRSGREDLLERTIQVAAENLARLYPLRARTQ